MRRTSSLTGSTTQMVPILPPAGKTQRSSVTEGERRSAVTSSSGDGIASRAEKGRDETENAATSKEASNMQDNERAVGLPWSPNGGLEQTEGADDLSVKESEGGGGGELSSIYMVTEPSRQKNSTDAPGPDATALETGRGLRQVPSNGSFWWGWWGGIRVCSTNSSDKEHVLISL